MGYDAFVISSPLNIRYITGFSGSNALCVVRKSDAWFLTDSRYALQARMEVKGFKRKIVKNDLYEEVGLQHMLKGCRKAAFESNTVTYAQYRILKKSNTRVSFAPTNNLVEDIALIKEKGEIEFMRTAARISDKVFASLLGILKPGVVELDIAAEISYLHRKHGAEKDAFDSIVASGVRGAFPHARASSKRLKKGEFVTLDFGCTVKGYNSDITRTVAIGKPPAEACRMYDVVYGAQREAVERARPGLWAKDLDAVARRRITDGGFGRFFTHSLGHGLGLQVHERPRVSPLSKERLYQGSVITIEPGVYVPGVGGVRIEDDVVLTSDSCEVLTQAPKELIVV